MRRSVRTCLLSALPVIGMGSARAHGATYNLSDLINNNQSVTVDDKTFSDFGVQGSIPASDITVNTLTSPEGLQFKATWTSTGAANVDTVISYLASTSSAQISNVGLTFDGTTVGANNILTNASVTETVSASDKTTVLGQLGVVDFGPGNPLNKDSDSLPIIPPMQTLFLQKDIKANSNGGGTATITFVDNTFTQVPEPSCMAVLGLGAVAALRRRRGF